MDSTFCASPEDVLLDSRVVATVCSRISGRGASREGNEVVSFCRMSVISLAETSCVARVCGEFKSVSAA